MQQSYQDSIDYRSCKKLSPQFLLTTCSSLIPSAILLPSWERQLSSVVEQRFCKPSVVGSNPTAGSSSWCFRIKELQKSERPLSVKLSVNRVRLPNPPQY